MIDINTPVTNPKLLCAIAEMQENNNAETQNKMIYEMMQSHFLIPAQIMPPPQQSDASGEITLKKDTLIEFSMMTSTDEKSFYSAFTDWEELKKWKDNENQQTFILTFDDYAAMIDRNDSAAGFVINPCGGNIIISREMIDALRRQNSHVVERVIEKETKVMLGEPRIYPTDMIEAITKKLHTLKQVKAAWLRLLVKENEQSWLLVLDFAGDKRAMFDNVAFSAQPYLNGMYLDMVSYDDSFGQSAIADVKPFYKKKIFGIF